MRVLVVGMGSIGQKHYQVIKDLGHDVHGIDIEDSFSDHIKRAYQAVFICTPTHLHQEQAEKCAVRGIPCFIEKPFSQEWGRINEIAGLFDGAGVPNMVGCNLRFLPTMQEFRQIIRECGDSFSVLSVFGCNLNSWRFPGWKGYSQKLSEGGGIILEAIHELDYLSWIWGLPTLLGSMTSNLPIPGVEHDVNTQAAILCRHPAGTFSTACLNSLDWGLTRFCTASTGTITVRWDFKQDSVFLDEDGGRIVYPCIKDDMYVNQDKYFLEAVSEGEETVNSIASHSKILRLAFDAKNLGDYTSKGNVNKISK